MIKTSQDLYNFLVEKDVTRLCHFTKTKNLVHILSSTEGIVATAFIKNDVKHQNDLGRYDGQLEYVCCSIEYPNSWYWEKLRMRDSNYIFKEWVILCIDLDIIKHKKIKIRFRDESDFFIIQLYFLLTNIISFMMFLLHY